MGLNNNDQQYELTLLNNNLLQFLKYLKVFEIRLKFNSITLQYKPHDKSWMFKSSDGILLCNVKNANIKIIN